MARAPVVAARRRKRRRRRFGEEGAEEFERGIVVDAVHLFHCRLRLRPMGETKMVRGIAVRSEKKCAVPAAAQAEQ